MSIDTVIIEDEESIALVVRTVLSISGITAKEAYTGQDGLKIVKEEHPALVLLDVRLPDMDGWEVCRRLKSGRDDKPIVVFLTAATQAKDVQRATSVGGDFFISKPFEVNHLVSVVQDLLHKNR